MPDQKTDEYDLPDSHFDPEIDAAPALEPKEAPPEKDAPPPKKADGRDESGRFTKKPHNPRLVALATDLGLGEEEIAHSSPAELRELVNIEQTRALIRNQDDRHRSNVQDAIDQPVAPAPEKVEPLPELTDENCSPEISKYIKGLEGRLARLEGHVVHQAQLREATTREQVLDAAFGSLGEQYQKFLGAGAAQDLSGKPELLRRRALVSAAGITEKDTRGQIAQKVKAAAEALYAPLIKPVEDAYEPEEGRITEEQWNGSGLPKPTNRRTPPEPKGEKRASHAVASKMRELRISDEDFDSVEAQNLPD